VVAWTSVVGNLYLVSLSLNSRHLCSVKRLIANSYISDSAAAQAVFVHSRRSRQQKLLHVTWPEYAPHTEEEERLNALNPLHQFPRNFPVATGI